MTFLHVLLFAATVHRLTRLVTVDEVTEPLRGAAKKWGRKRRGGESKLAYFVTCPHCVSAQIAVWVAVAWAFLPVGLVELAGVAALASSVTGLVEEHL